MLRSRLLYGLLERKSSVYTYGYGNGAWNVAAGSINADSVVVSAGVGHDISFDLELSKRHGCRIIMVDPSPTGAATIARHHPLPEGLTFEPIGLSKVDEVIRFAEPSHPEEGSFRLHGDSASQTMHEFPCERLQTLMQRHQLAAIDLLKLDIEGFEYGVLGDAIASNSNVKQICVEFHHGIVPGISRRQTVTAILRVILSGYRLINHDGLNHTFIRQVS